MVERCHLSRPERMMIGEVVQAGWVEKLDALRLQVIRSPCVNEFHCSLQDLLS